MNKDLVKAVDIYRGLLAQYIIISHLIPTVFPHILGVPGTLAVWCFFITSGYLNFISLQRRPEALDYFKRRIIRLYPLLLISFAVVAFITGTIFVNDIYTLFPAVLWVKGYMPNNGVLWTIIIELQLYILSPYIVPLFMRISLKKWMVIFSLLILPFVSIILSKIVSKILTGDSDLDDRTFISALPFYFFGMILARAHFEGLVMEFFKSKYILVTAVSLFIIVVISRNSEFISWQSLFLEGRYIPFLLTAFLLTNVKLFQFFSYKGVLVSLGKLTYEIYLFHGLFVFIMYQTIPESGWLTIITFLWCLPIMTAFLYKFVSEFLTRKVAPA